MVGMAPCWWEIARLRLLPEWRPSAGASDVDDVEQMGVLLLQDANVWTLISYLRWCWADGRATTTRQQMLFENKLFSALETMTFFVKSQGSGPIRSWNLNSSIGIELKKTTVLVVPYCRKQHWTMETVSRLWTKCSSIKSSSAPEDSSALNVHSLACLHKLNNSQSQFDDQTDFDCWLIDEMQQYLRNPRKWHDP
jgi:hypothetical protein